MSNSLYDWGREGFLAGDIDWDANTIKVAAITSAYVVSLTVDKFLASIFQSLVLQISPALTGKTTSAGVADATDSVLSAFSGAVISALAFFQDTGNSATSRLIAYIDTATGLPFTPNSNDMDLVFDSGVNRIFKL